MGMERSLQGTGRSGLAGKARVLTLGQALGARSVAGGRRSDLVTPRLEGYSRTQENGRAEWWGQEVEAGN